MRIKELIEQLNFLTEDFEVEIVDQNGYVNPIKRIGVCLENKTILLQTERRKRES